MARNIFLQKVNSSKINLFWSSHLPQMKEYVKLMSLFLRFTKVPDLLIILYLKVK